MVNQMIRCVLAAVQMLFNAMVWWNVFHIRTSSYLWGNIEKIVSVVLQSDCLQKQTKISTYKGQWCVWSLDFYSLSMGDGCAFLALKGGRGAAWLIINSCDVKISLFSSQWSWLIFWMRWWMKSSRVVRASDSQCRSRNCSGFDPSILRHSGIRGAVDEAVLNIVHKK